MPVPNVTQVIPGAAVSIVLKADQPTGRQVQGIVGNVLTRGNHPRGIKVRLSDGRVGRVQKMHTGGLEQALVNIIGVKPTYMRPPYLATGGNVLPTMKNLGYRVITDDIDSEDWNGKTPAQSQQKFQQAGAGGNGHITLMHESTLFSPFSLVL